MTQAFEPPISDDGAPFWEATRTREFVLPWCVGCDRPIWYPRATCPICLVGDLEWRAASGQGVVYAVGVHHLPGPGRDASELPYTVALIDLAEGVRMMSNVVDCPPESVRVGMDVAITWKPLSDGRHLPQFAPR